ncbi:MAG: sensor histidine kinase [Aureispira sp.]
METNPNVLTIFLLLGIGTLLLVILLLSLFIFIRMHLKRMRIEEQKKLALTLQHQKELSTALVEEQERERARIAAELHDDLIANLYRIKLTNADEQINGMLKESIQRARKLSHELSPPMLEALPIETLMLDFLEPFQQHYTLQGNFNPSNNKLLDRVMKLQLFRIFQEVLTNIDKHANATEIEVIYRFQKKYCCLIIKDNGVGFDPKTTTGLGLKNITLRTQILNGSYRLKSNGSQGTTFIFLRYEQPK